jgi:2-polyprenyl-3-methyl-5-hydroxy-6-metoxy-1,4-benzoquinol methylase
MSELERIREAYSKRTINTVHSINPEDLFFIQERQRAVIKLFKELGAIDLSKKIFLDAGCGNGINLKEIVMCSADPKKCLELTFYPQK